MVRNKKKEPLFIKNVEIIDTANKGRSFARHDGRAIFIDKGVPGDICDIKVFKRRRKFWEASIVKIHTLSKNRTIPKCIHFGTCGGCKWQNMKYTTQLKFKQNEVLNNLKRIGSIEIPIHQKIIGSKEKYLYRNKMEFTFSNKRWLSSEEIESKKEINDRSALGFHIPGMFDKVIDLESCHLQKEPSNTIRLSIKNFADQNNLSYFDIRNQTGLLRNLMIRTSTTNELMVLVQFFEYDQKKIDLLMNHIYNSFKEITSLLYVINNKANNTIYDQKIICFKGKEHITETLDGLKFRINAKSFFQTNSDQAKVLYRKTKELAQIKNTDIVYDLYTGTGTIAQYVSSAAKKVIGIDSVEDAIKDAKKNAEINNIKNCKFYAGDMKKIFSKEFISKNKIPNIIITDPPREGMHIDVIKQILKIKPKRIVYVSCNSATQARDVAFLNGLYHTTHIQPIDMFPQTHHVENIIVLEKSNIA